MNGVNGGRGQRGVGERGRRAAGLPIVCVVLSPQSQARPSVCRGLSSR